MDDGGAAGFRILRTGAEGFAAMLEAIAAARRSVRLETYIFSDSAVGRRIRGVLVEARGRGADVRVLVDAFGSMDLAEGFWAPLREAGGHVRWFNPLSLRRWAYRDHRKVLVCDERVAIIGGFNIAEEYDGDGVDAGWRDLGLELSGPPALGLARSFDRMMSMAGFRHKRLQRLRRARDRSASGVNWRVLSSGPGCRHGEIKRVLAQDLRGAARVRIMSAYFLPTWRLRREMRRVARRGGRVQLILAGRTDVPLSLLASRRLYRSLLRSGVEIYEYQPQILHAKLVVIDDAVYAGSANLDTRSLSINYEVLARVRDAGLAAEAAAVFDADLKHCRRITRAGWRRSRTWWTRLRERFAYVVLAKLDLLLVRWQMKSLR